MDVKLQLTNELPNFTRFVDMNTKVGHVTPTTPFGVSFMSQC